ncbi:pentapeptide repeat-containing protein [Streptomyces thermoviolaceus]|uniref:pentapeptide repeat-containing protein n=1 Tax=Streptomyces thermoviolaceus TaxID=1952 RepID=UPI0033BE798B
MADGDGPAQGQSLRLRPVSRSPGVGCPRRGRPLRRRPREGRSRRGDLDRANLDGADLGSAELWGVDASGASLRGSRLHGAALLETKLYGADLSHATVRETSFKVFLDDRSVVEGLTGTVFGPARVAGTEGVRELGGGDLEVWLTERGARVEVLTP